MEKNISLSCLCSAYHTKFFANKLMCASPDIPWHMPTKPLSRTGWSK